MPECESRELADRRRYNQWIDRRHRSIFWALAAIAAAIGYALHC